MAEVKHLKLSEPKSPLRPEVAHTHGHTHEHPPESLPEPKEVKVHPTGSGSENATIYFVGTATTIMYVPHEKGGRGRVWGCGD